MRQRVWAMVVLVAVALVPHLPSAASPPQVVIDDVLSLGVPLTTVSLDSTHFSERVLLVGTDTNQQGNSFVIRLRATPLTILDTVITLGTRVRQVRSGFLDSDSDADFLVGLDSCVVRYRPGPMGGMDTIPIRVDFTRWFFGEIRDTVSLAGRVYDIEVDDVQRAFWVAYRASITYYPWYNEQVGKSVGGLLRFQSLAATGSEVSRGGSVIDIALSTQCAGSGRCLVACWHYFYWNEVHVVGNEPRYASGGYRVFGADGEAMSSHGVKAVSAPGGQASLGIRVPAPMADLTGDGVPEIVFSYSASQWRPGTPSIRHDSTQIVTVGNDVPLWELGRSAHSSVWQVDADGLPDVLLHGRTETIGYQGYTGLPLFVLATQRNLHPVTTGALKAGGGQRGVLLSLDTLLVYHFDFGTLATRRFTPTLFTLHPNYPNPFNPSTTVSYTLHFASYVKLTVFDVLGRRIRILEDNTQASGDYSVDWDGTDQSDQQVASGVYFIRLTASNQTETRKAVLVR